MCTSNRVKDGEIEVFKLFNDSKACITGTFFVAGINIFILPFTAFHYGYSHSRFFNCFHQIGKDTISLRLKMKDRSSLRNRPHDPEPLLQQGPYWFCLDFRLKVVCSSRPSSCGVSRNIIDCNPLLVGDSGIMSLVGLECFRFGEDAFDRILVYGLVVAEERLG